MLNVSLWVLLWSSALSPSTESPLLGETFESRRLHVRVRPPAGWRLVSTGASQDEPIEFWKAEEAGPRVQITSFPYPLSDGSEIDQVQAELAEALVRRFPDLRVDQETRLVHGGHPAIEVMATFSMDDTYYHVIQRCLFARGRIFIITCASFESSFLSDLATFRASMDSLEILDGIFDLNPTSSQTPLITFRTMGMLVFGSLITGFFLRRLSVAKLGRMSN